MYTHRIQIWASDAPFEIAVCTAPLRSEWKDTRDGSGWPASLSASLMIATTGPVVSGMPCCEMNAGPRGHGLTKFLYLYQALIGHMTGSMDGKMSDLELDHLLFLLI